MKMVGFNPQRMSGQKERIYEAKSFVQQVTEWMQAKRANTSLAECWGGCWQLSYSFINIVPGCACKLRVQFDRAIQAHKEAKHFKEFMKYLTSFKNVIVLWKMRIRLIFGRDYIHKLHGGFVLCLICGFS